jgi:hypothetical protein
VVQALMAAGVDSAAIAGAQDCAGNAIIGASGRGGAGSAGGGAGGAEGGEGD